MERKEFLKNITLGSLGVVVGGSILSACSKDDSKDEPVDFTINTDEDDYKALKEDGGFVSKDRIFIINNGGDIIAISKTCTHQECPVTYIPSSKQFPCPCHGSVFDINGNVLQGPAQIPLKKFTVTVTGTMIRVTE